MAKFEIVKGFRCGEKDAEMRKKGKIVELSGKELEFAKENDCVKPYKEPKK